MDIYTPSKDKVIHQTYVDLNKRGVNKPIHLVQYDHGLPIVAVNLYSDGFVYTLPENVYVNS